MRNNDAYCLKIVSSITSIRLKLMFQACVEKANRPKKMEDSQFQNHTKLDKKNPITPEGESAIPRRNNAGILRNGGEHTRQRKSPWAPREQLRQSIIRVVSNYQLKYLLRLTVGFTAMINETPQIAFTASINNLQNQILLL